MSQRAQAEILHLENLLQLRSTSVQELTSKVNSLQKALNRSTPNTELNLGNVLHRYLRIPNIIVATLQVLRRPFYLCFSQGPSIIVYADQPTLRSSYNTGSHK